jgi:hypothetical protein
MSTPVANTATENYLCIAEHIKDDPHKFPLSVSPLFIYSLLKTIGKNNFKKILFINYLNYLLRTLYSLFMRAESHLNINSYHLLN